MTLNFSIPNRYNMMKRKDSGLMPQEEIYRYSTCAPCCSIVLLGFQIWDDHPLFCIPPFHPKITILKVYINTVIHYDFFVAIWSLTYFQNPNDDFMVDFLYNFRMEKRGSSYMYILTSTSLTLSKTHTPLVKF